MESHRGYKGESSHVKDETAGIASERRMTNQDFRVLLMTPRSTRVQVPTDANSGTGSVKKYKHKKTILSKIKKKKSAPSKETEEDLQEDADTKKRLEMHYRDRAKERREGLVQEQIDIQQLTSITSQHMNTISKVAIGATDANVEDIDKTKYLGGDMMHTHLVKGLDYALLKRVKLENTQQRIEVAKKVGKNIIHQDLTEGSLIKFNSILARNIYNLLFERAACNSCELFYPGRMAYVFELSNDCIEHAIPTTVVRSRMEVSMLDKRNMVSASGVVIQKLAHILGYLRHGARAASRKSNTVSEKPVLKSNTAVVKPKTPADDCTSIYDDVDAYDPREALAKYEQEKLSKQSKSVASGPYFEKETVSEAKDEMAPTTAAEDGVGTATSMKDTASKMVKGLSSGRESIMAVIGAGDQQMVQSVASQAREKKLKALSSMPDSYAECYPGAIEMMDAAVDSDNEADYTKMDMGKRKSAVNRWDFDNEEEYGRYLDAREAMPKAAYQYGIKTSEGRKTRRQQAEKEKAKLDREWERISKIISCRKGGGDRSSDPNIPAAAKKKRIGQ